MSTNLTRLEAIEELRKEVISQKSARIEPEDSDSIFYSLNNILLDQEREISTAVINAIQGNYYYEIPYELDLELLAKIENDPSISKRDIRKAFIYRSQILRLNHTRELLIQAQLRGEK
jgi:hypothetical protein